MASAILLGIGIAASAAVGKIGIDAFKKYRNINGSVKNFVKGGFEPKMSRTEAIQILSLNSRGLTRQKVKTAHRRLMLANHPDRGGSAYVASKVNEAKGLLDADRSIRGFSSWAIPPSRPVQKIPSVLEAVESMKQYSLNCPRQ
ncbi:TIM23 translocase complex subunit Tim14 [Schizosaccharomyces octosporus yFS286]|uniref:Mitochondrial import inner membrane translocase subunit TIM14 n=1 Tax=Schizosaccharomyces octosporus (strain yFS286) TaxID=483514 RepID=S9Q0Z8_SCHOY|nr:TIM23 translocase complex subunit Tim14 [Schizosaccharomyces octosporus yFS286]EPX74951.1 TIM23 translocase complex subunit Tim14 [Schizosaccharomyces octosporus yFS286]